MKYRLAMISPNGDRLIGQNIHDTLQDAVATKNKFAPSLKKNCVVIPDYYTSHENKLVQGAPVMHKDKEWIVLEVFGDTVALYGRNDNNQGLTPAPINEVYIAGKVVYTYA